MYAYERYISMRMHRKHSMAMIYQNTSKGLNQCKLLQIISLDAEPNYSPYAVLSY